MFKKNFQNPIFWGLLIFFAAGFFRLLFFNLIEFKSDEALFFSQIVNFYNHPTVIQRGIITSLGTYSFPLFTYILIILSAIIRNPQFLTFSIALINTLTVVIFYFVVKRIFGNTTAIFGSLILAFLPWGIIFSRKIWPQDLLLILLIPLIYLLNRLILKKNQKFTFLIFLIFALAIQLHSSGIFLFVSTIIILLIFRIKLDLKSAILGIIAGSVTVIPFLIFQLKANPLCPDCEAFLKYQNSIRIRDIYNFIRPFQIMTGMGFHFILGSDYEGFTKAFPQINFLRQVFLATPLIFTLGVISIVKEKRKYLYLLFYVAIIPSLYFITKTKAFMHYFIILIPILTIIYALGFTFIFEKANKIYLKIFTLFLFGVFLLSNIIFQFSLNQFLESKQNINGDYGPIFSVTQKKVEEMTSQYKNLPSYQKIVSIAYLANSGKVEKAKEEINASGFDQKFAEKLEQDLGLKK